jgi:histidinol-phosphatase (PHP family)
LEQLHHHHIPIIISSDAHYPDDLVNKFPETAEMLLSIGFKEISILSDGAWQATKI